MALLTQAFGLGWDVAAPLALNEGVFALVVLPLEYVRIAVSMMS